MSIDDAEFVRWMQLVRDDLADVQRQLNVIDERLRTVETKLAVVESRGGGESGGPGKAAAWGGGIAGACIALAETVKWFLAK